MLSHVELLIIVQEMKNSWLYSRIIELILQGGTLLHSQSIWLSRKFFSDHLQVTVCEYLVSDVRGISYKVIFMI